MMCISKILRTVAALGLAVTCTLGAASSCGSSGGNSGGGSNAQVPGTAPALVSCTETPDPDGVGSSGVSVQAGFVFGTIDVACSGGSPDSYQINVILVRDGVLLKPGSPSTQNPGGGMGYQASTFVECQPGTYHVYYLVVWSINGKSVTNQGDKMTTTDTAVTAHDCA